MITRGVRIDGDQVSGTQSHRCIMKRSTVGLVTVELLKGMNDGEEESEEEGDDSEEESEETTATRYRA